MRPMPARDIPHLDHSLPQSLLDAGRAGGRYCNDGQWPAIAWRPLEKTGQIRRGKNAAIVPHCAGRSRDGC